MPQSQSNSAKNNGTQNNSQDPALKRQGRSRVEATITPAKNDSSLVLKIIAILAVIAFLAYANTLSNGYAIDDIEVLQNNAYVNKGFQGIVELLTTPHLRGFMIAPNETYRPLSLVMFAIEFQFWGANPAVGHCFNILVFVGCVVLLFIFLDKLFEGKRRAVAFVTCILFALHPIHTEVVANIKSRDELLCFFFAILSLILFSKSISDNKPAHLLTGTAALFFSFISKETTITFLGIIPLIFFFYRQGNRNKSIIITIGAIFSALAFLLIRAAVLKANNNTTMPLSIMDNNLAKAPDFLTHVATAVMVLGMYLKLLIFPYPLSIDYSYNSVPFVGFGNVWVLLSLAVYLALISVGIFRLIKFRKDPWALGILFFLITLSLFSNIAFLIGSGMNERFLFFPSVGFCWLVALAIEKWVVQREYMPMAALKSRNVLLILLPVLVFYTTVTFGRNEQWTDSETLFEADLQKVPNNSRLNYCVGYSYVVEKCKNEPNPVEKKKLLAQGIAYLRKSIDLCPEYCNAQTEIGDAYFQAGMYDSAEVHDKLALKINPKASEVLNNLAGVYFVTGKYADALRMCQQAVIIRPMYAQAYYNIGLCFNNLKNYDSSVVYLKKALQLDPAFVGQAGEVLAKTYNALNNADSSRKYDSMVRLNKGRK